MTIILVMGPPGSGKGTQAKLLKDKLNIAHISTGDLFRAEIGNETELGKKAKEYIDQGKYVPDEITIDMLKKRIEQSDCENGFILDGFPRTIPQAEFLDKMLEEQGKKVDFAIYYNVDNETTIGRIKKRARQDKEAGRPVRDDDLDEATIQQRLDTYHSQTATVLDYYKEQGNLVELDASKTAEEIFDASSGKLGF